MPGIVPMEYISIHAPVKGATRFPLCSSDDLSHFNPRSREGSDGARSAVSSPASYFNPRSREGSDKMDFLKVDEAGISIHAPVKGATSADRAAVDTKVFQSTLP